MEIVYCRFLDLIELQSQHDKAADGTTTIPRLDQVRIGKECIYFRVHRPTTTMTTAAETDEPTTTTEQAKPPQRRFLSLFQRKPRAPPSILRAYTRPVEASPQLVAALRQHAVDFTALT